MEAGRIADDGYKSVMLDTKMWRCHRLIFLIETGSMPAYVDHINGDILDNRFPNLRAATIAENGQNKRRKSNSSSVFKGVARSSSKTGWQTYIKIGSKHQYLGCFKEEREAARAYDKAAVAAFGPFARTNEMMGLL